jgi:hypothetical protein
MRALGWRLFPVVAAIALAACGDDKLEDDGVLSVMPDELDFGPAFLWEEIGLPVRFENGSRIPVTYSWPGEGDFRLEPAEVAVPAGSHVDAEIRFRPSEVGDRTAILALPDGDAIALRGRGVAHALEVDGLLDFGEVPVGQADEVLPLRIVNPTELPATISLDLDEQLEGIFWVARTAAVAAGGRVEVLVGFVPPQAMPFGGKILVSPCPSCEPYRVEIRGRGVAVDYEVAPRTLDFGTVVLGETRRETLRIIARGRLDVSVNELRLLQPPGGPFTLEERPELPAVIRPGTALDLDFVFAPTATGDAAATLRLQLGSDVVDVPVSGSAVDLTLLASPAAVDFGVIARGAEATTTVVIAATGSFAPQVDVRIDDTSGHFTATPRRTLPASLATPLEVDVTFHGAAVGPHATDLRVIVYEPEMRLLVPLRGHVLDAPPCTLEFGPAELRFGTVRAGVAHRRSITLRNAGPTDCPVWGFGFAPGGSTRFSLPETSPDLQLLAPGAGLEVPVEYLAPEPSAGIERAVLRFFASPPDAPPKVVPVSAAATGWDLALVPAALAFGPVPLGAAPLGQVVLENRSGLPARVEDASVSGEGFAPVSPPALPATAVPGHTLAFPVTFSPTGVGHHTGLLEVWLDGLPEALLADLSGTGTLDPCGDACLVPDAACSAPLRAYARTEVELRGVATAPGELVPTCAWSLLEVPPTSAAAIPDPAACVASFVPDLPGRYRAELTVSLPDRDPATCVVETTVEPLPPLWIETSWDVEADVDLHLFHPDAGDPALPETWFDEAYDCFFGNMSPFWDGPGRDDDPLLDRDDAGVGPERISIARPALDHSYTVGVHYFRRANLPAVEAVTRIYCGGEPAGELATPLDLPGQGVVVGEVRFTSPTECTFTPDGARYTVGDGT